MEIQWVLAEGPVKSYPSVIVKDNDLEVTVHYDLEDRGVVIKRIGGDDLTATVLRTVRIGEIRKAIHKSLPQNPEHRFPLAMFAKLVEEGRLSASDEDAEILRAARDAASEATKYLMTNQPQRGRAAANSEWYGHVARVYLDFYAEHGQRAVKAMAHYLDAEVNTVYWWIRRAREEGWLTMGQQGRAGANPGPRLIKWHREQEGP
jgi:hypothetical protein